MMEEETAACFQAMEEAESDVEEEGDEKEYASQLIQTETSRSCGCRRGAKM